MTLENWRLSRKCLKRKKMDASSFFPFPCMRIWRPGGSMPLKRPSLWINWSIVFKSILLRSSRPSFLLLSRTQWKDFKHLPFPCSDGGWNQTYVLNEEVSRSNIRRLSALTSDDRIAILSLISSLKLVRTAWGRPSLFLEEISRRNQCQEKDIVQRSKFRPSFFRKNLLLSEKQACQKSSYGPPLPKVKPNGENLWEKKEKTWNLPSNISLHHPPFLREEIERSNFSLKQQKNTELSFPSFLTSRIMKGSGIW